MLLPLRIARSILNKSILTPDPSSVHLVDGRSVTWFRDRFAGGASRFQPELLGQLRLFQCIGRSFSESRTGVQMGDIRDIALIRAAIEDVEVIIPGHSFTFLMLPFLT